MKKLKEKNLPKALETINKMNLQSEELVRQQLNTKLILNDPKMTDQELYDIQKFANQGLLNQEEMGTVDDKTSLVSKSATAMLMESNYSSRDDLISTITKSKKESIIGKRAAKVTSEQILKEAQDALVF